MDASPASSAIKAPLTIRLRRTRNVSSFMQGHSLSVFFTPLGRGLPSATRGPAPAPCIRRRRRSPAQQFLVRRPKPHGKKLLPLTRTGNLPRANEQSAGLFVAHCGAPPCTGRGCPASGCAPWAGLAFCDPRPCSGSLHPPQAAVACAAIPRTETKKSPSA